MSLPYQAILLIAFGGPTSSEEIRPFLARVTKGVPIPTERIEEVAHHYEAVGGRSPLNEITFLQAKALYKLLNQRGTPFPVHVGMRNSQPFFIDALKQMAATGVKRALGCILSAHRSEASWERYQENIEEARHEIGASAPEIDYCGQWHDHPLFIQCWTELVQAAFAQIDLNNRQSTPLIFSAHSLPLPMAARSPYVEQVAITARLTAEKLRHQPWSIAYQSRSGRPADPWLEPDIKDAIRKLGREGCNEVIVAPIGFVYDHVEVLYDLDIEAKQIAHDLGMNLIRASCPNDHPTFIRMMAEVIKERIKATEDGG
jgi:protoporphyrin/coproporphyrin ferrochelatase